MSVDLHLNLGSALTLMKGLITIVDGLIFIDVVVFTIFVLGFRWHINRTGKMWTSITYTFDSLQHLFVVKSISICFSSTRRFYWQLRPIVLYSVRL